MLLKKPITLAMLVLTLPVFGILMLLHAPPYGMSETTWVLRSGEGDHYPRFSQPWAIRLFWVPMVPKVRCGLTGLPALSMI